MRRRGFTLVEILVVITILILLTLLVVSVYRGNDAQKVRDAGRVMQSSILGARDRALHAKLNRGFRIVRDPQDTNIGTGIAYVQPSESLKFGRSVNGSDVSFENIDNNADGKPDVLRIHGLSTPGWQAIEGFNAFSNPKLLRYPVDTGRWLEWNNLQVISATHETVDVPLPEGITVGSVYAAADSRAQVEFKLFNELLPNHAPISLPVGVVIDLANSSAQSRGDIIFSPRGMVTDSFSGVGPIYLLLRDIRDVTEGISPTNTSAGIIHRDMLIVSIIPATGHVQNYPVDLTDTNADGTADDLFRFAKLGSAAGG